MEQSCCYMNVRSFPTRQEKAEMLKDYQDALEKELQGVKERINELEKSA
jgi:coproporphyrinogen III oxidase-like Fe-S oxidoreductase